MRSTYVARNASIAAVADEIEPSTWEIEPAPAVPIHGNTRTEDGLRSARGIFAAVLAGAAIWLGLGWGAAIALDRMFS